MVTLLRTPWKPFGRRLAARRRRGAALALFAVCLIPLLACVALAIDLGILTLAQTQLSDAADATALAGARALNGDTSQGRDNNYAAVTPTAEAVLTNNTLLGSNLATRQLNLRIGCYTYNTTNERFEGQLDTKPATDNWNLVQATVTANVGGALGFSKIFNYVVPNLQAVATAAHRPRDVCLILDYSGSMRFGSLVGLPYYNDYSHPNRYSNNQHTLCPAFGHYSSSDAGMVGSSPSSPYDDANITTTTADGRAPIIQDFYTGASGGAAFAAASSGYATTPGGDNFLKSNKNGGATYAQHVKDVLNLSSVSNSTAKNVNFETYGYNWSEMNPAPPTFAGYTQGPGYYGKTFFIWPPDPRPTKDWRKLYFYKPGTTTGMDDNSKLWDTSGYWKAPGSTTYKINYDAILNFIKNVGPNPFPSTLRAGRILYYDAIPDTIVTTSWPPANLNQRFWKDYIDYVLGVMQTSSTSYSLICSGSSSTNYLQGSTGYGADFAWGTVRITALGDLTASPKPYMRYDDNPLRPRLHFWFGPLTMIDFLGNYNLWGVSGNSDYTRYCWWPGTCHETPLYACKLGVRAALNDIQNNHPNDMVSLIMFSHPRESYNDGGGARFNRVRVRLSRDYASMHEALWYPPSTIGSPSATVSPYHAENLEVPRATGGTCYAMALMLAYNQFSSNAALRSFASPAGDAGGNGRRGAQKILIFESDGQPTFTASASLSGSGTCQKYYAIRYNSANPSGSEYPTGVDNKGGPTDAVTTQIYNLCTQLANAESAGGYSSPSRKLLIHCIAFGPQGAAATGILTQMQQIGNVTDGMPSYKIVDGTETQIISKLQTAIAKILQDGVQVSLIQ